MSTVGNRTAQDLRPEGPGASRYSQYRRMPSLRTPTWKTMVDRGIETECALWSAGDQSATGTDGTGSRLPSLIDEAVQKFVATRASAAVDEST